MLLLVSLELILSAVCLLRAAAGPITLQSIGIRDLKVPAKVEF